MLKQKGLMYGAAVAAALLVGGQASAAITVLHTWDLGDNDPGAAAGSTANATTVDSTGSLDLDRVGSPAYLNTPTTGLGVALDNAPGHLVAANDYINTASSFTVTDGTNWGVEAWVRLDADPGENDTALFSMVDAGNSFQYILQSFGGGWSVHVPNIALFAPKGSVAAAVDNWTHIALVMNGSTLELYQDGVLYTDNETAYTGTTINNFTIGADVGGMRGFDGDMGVVRVFEFAEGGFNINDTLVPEPASVALIGMGGLLMLRRRRA